MRLLDTVIVALVVAAAALYLWKVLNPQKGSGGNCGCGSVDCKVPKPKITPKQSHMP